MSEELEKKNLPKATLIKHKKPAAEADTSKTEKKKVVVVKKKKKPVAKAVASNENDQSTGSKPSVKVTSDNTKQKPSGAASAKTVKGERPLGGSRKGRSQDDIFSSSNAEAAAPAAPAQPAPAKAVVKPAATPPSRPTPSRPAPSRPMPSRPAPKPELGEGSNTANTPRPPRPVGDQRGDNRPGGGYQGRQGGYQGGSGGYQGQSDSRQGGG